MTEITKPSSMFSEFTRKVGKDKLNTHYCPGCGHGRIQKYIAQAIDELSIQDRVIFLSSVGCSVFAYQYMDTGNIQCSHGRSPAVGTGVSRAAPNSVVISYQGDGDLSSIGGNEILHAANRGENMVVFFINNAVYGMTGGQMAPTTLSGQKTLTTPQGRSTDLHGYPLKMSEIIATLDAPIYVERVSCSDIKGITKTRKAITKAIKLVSERKGFCFVEILSACPTNWKKTPLESIEWMKNSFEATFPPKMFKDISQEAVEKPVIKEIFDPEAIFSVLGLPSETPSSQPVSSSQNERYIKFAGFGGQGVLTSGLVLTHAAMNAGLESSWIPSYGPEMRGGTTNCSVVLSGEKILSPIFRKPDVLIAMNSPSLEAFLHDVVPQGIIIYDSSISSYAGNRKDLRLLPVPMSEIAIQVNHKASANLVALGALLGLDSLFSLDSVFHILEQKFPKKQFLEPNKKAVIAGYEWARQNAFSV